MFSILHGLTFELLGRKSQGGVGLGDQNWELQVCGVFMALLIGLNIYLAVMHWRAYSLFLRILVGVLFSLILLGALFAIANFFGLVVWGGIFIVVLTLVVQLPRARRRATLDLLTLAIEKRMPLPPIIKALAADQRANWRLFRLANNLESGMPLSAAIKADKRLLPANAIVAAQMGEATGNLAAAFRQAKASETLSAPLRQGLLGHTFYLVSLAFVVPVVFGFVTIFIIPKFIAIFDDFGIELPRLTVWGVRFAHSFAWIWFCMPIVGAVLLIYAILCYAEVWPLAALGRGRRFERGGVLRTMAIATEAQRPLPDTLSALAQNYPRQKTARHLQACAEETRAGAAWNVSLLKHGLIGVQDAALIDAAQRLGNLPWALREAADGSDRRLIYRMEAMLNVVSPIVMLVWGVIIFLFAVACFLPLIKLIFALAG